MAHEAFTEENLGTLVGTFYGRVRQDPLIGPVFNGAVSDWPEHLDKLQAFWSSTMLKTGRYEGRPMPAHIRHASSISDASFARWLSIWHEVVDELFAPAAAAALKDKAGRIAESLALGIRHHGGMAVTPTP
jgi:hemoglobin